MDQWDAHDYSKNSPEQRTWGLELLNKIALSGQERVIDLGCGDGRITAEIASRLPMGSVLGVDKSEDMIRFAAKHFSRERFPNLDFIAQDICSLDYFQEFDLAYSNAVLHWIPDHVHALKAITRGLKAGGRFVAQMGGKGNAAGILNVLETITQSKTWSSFFKDFSPPYTFYDSYEYKLLLQSAGLTTIRIEAIPKRMSHDGEEGLAAWIRTTWLPYTRRIPADLQSTFIHEIVDTYATTQHFDTSAPIYVEMVRLEFEAVKDHENNTSKPGSDS